MSPVKDFPKVRRCASASTVGMASSLQSTTTVPPEPPPLTRAPYTPLPGPSALSSFSITSSSSQPRPMEV